MQKDQTASGKTFLRNPLLISLALLTTMCACQVLTNSLASKSAPLAALEERSQTNGSLCLSLDGDYEVSSVYPGYPPRRALLTGTNDLHEAILPQDRSQKQEFAFHTKEELNPYIIIDLKRSCQVEEIIVQNRLRQCQERAQGLTMWASSDKTYWKQLSKPQAPSASWLWRGKAPENMRYLKLSLNGVSYFHLARVQVYGRYLEEPDTEELLASKGKEASTKTGQTIASGEGQPGSGAKNRPVLDKWAVVVGVSKFADAKLNLRYPAKDAQDFYNYLVTKGNFAPDHIKLLLNENATKDRILDVLGDSWLPRLALPDDLVVIFISSHGSASDSDICGVNYVVTYDTNPDKLFTTGIAMKSLAATIKERVHSERVLVVLDTCHAGGASESKGLTRNANADALSFSQGTGQMVVCSSDKNQVSWEGKNMQNSVFTRNLIDAFQERGAQSPISEVFKTVKEKVEEQVVRERGVLQTPVVEASKWSGNEIILGCRPLKPRPGKL